jgi:hypothetical protein
MGRRAPRGVLAAVIVDKLGIVRRDFGGDRRPSMASKARKYGPIDVPRFGATVTFYKPAVQKLPCRQSP